MANTAQNGKKRTAKRATPKRSGAKSAGQDAAKRAAQPEGAKAAAATAPRKTAKPQPTQTKDAKATSAKRARPKPRPAPPPEDFPFEDDFEGAAEDTYDVDMDQAAASAARATMMDGETYLDFLARMFEDMSTGGWNADQIDALTQGYSMVLGSGPAFVALESMVSNVSSQSAVMMNAAHTQRQLDHVGLCCTSACVKQLLSLNSGSQDD